MYLPLIFFAFGAILFLGYFANIVFKRLKISSVLLLMGIGLILGPILNVVDVSEGSVLKQLSPVVGALALITILFDAGTKMNFNRLIRTLPRASAFTIVVFILTVVGVGAFLHNVFGWSWIFGLMFGAAVGGTSSPIVIPIIEKVSVSPHIRDYLSLESTFTDVLCVISVVLLIQAALDPAVITIQDILGNLIAVFSVSFFLGSLMACIWIFILSKIKTSHEYNYVLTIALVFILYALTEMSFGSGAIAVFVFGLVLGHERELSRWIKIDKEFLIPKRFMVFQNEVTFFVRTFFFVYIGLLISRQYFTAETMLLGIVVLTVALVTRKLAQLVTLRNIEREESYMVITFLPRGLAAAVLASLPLLYGLFIPSFEEGVFMTILMTNVFASLAVYVIEHKRIGENAREVEKVEEKKWSEIKKARIKKEDKK